MNWIKLLFAGMLAALMAGSSIAFADGYPAGEPAKRVCSTFDIACLLNPYLVASGLDLMALQCPATHPVACENVGLCFEDWIDCDTVVWCKDNYYGCDSARQLICVNNNNPLCFDNCVDPNTIGYCGSGYFGCWKLGCKYDDATQFNCVSGSVICCPTDYPKYVDGVCWPEDWECTSDAHCPSTHHCSMHKCVLNPVYAGPASMVCTAIKYDTCTSNSANGATQDVHQLRLGEPFRIVCHLKDVNSQSITGGTVEIYRDDQFFGSGTTQGGWIYFPVKITDTDNLCYRETYETTRLFALKFTGSIVDQNAMSPVTVYYELQIGDDEEPPEPPPQPEPNFLEQFFAAIMGWFCQYLGLFCN